MLVALQQGRVREHKASKGATIIVAASPMPPTLTSQALAVVCLQDRIGCCIVLHFKTHMHCRALLASAHLIWAAPRPALPLQRRPGAAWPPALYAVETLCCIKRVLETSAAHGSPGLPLQQ